MSNYPGNSSLGDEVKRRILGTYEQSVELAERGRNQEAILGCDFVLELDPQFAPARVLRDRLSGGGGAPFPDDEPAPAAAAQASPARSAIQEADDLFDLDSFGAEDVPEEPTQAPAAAASDGLAARLRERLDERDFRGVLEEAERQREALAADPEAAQIAEIARTRLEAQPYVEGFLREAGTSIRSGDLDQADLVLEKARSLDPNHPLLEGLEVNARRARSGAAAAPPPATPPPAASPPDEDDVDLLGGFEIPGLNEPAAEGWEEPASSPSPSAGAVEPDLDDDLFSFDAPELEPPASETPASSPAAATPAADSGAGGDDRIGELLAAGQKALDGGDFQGAIDAWSRIFLIDVDHAEAARRIETARRMKAERERAVEEVFHEGLSALEGGDADVARGHFERVLEMQPNHLAARDYLRQIDSGEPIKVSRGPSPDETVAMGSLGTFDLSDLAGSQGGAAGDKLREEILVPPPPSQRGADAAQGALPTYGKSTSVKREAGKRTFLLVGGLVLAIVVAGALWLFGNKERFFPNSDAEEPVAGQAATAATETTTPLDRAKDLHERGQTAMALGLLKRIRPDDPQYAEAQELIAQWEAPAKAADEAAADTVPPEAQERQQRLLKAAETEYQRGEYLLASELYERAAQIAPLGDTAKENRKAVERQLEPLSEEIELFRLGEYELLLPRLWRLYQEDSSNQDVRRMLVDSYYNRGVRELQRGNASAAADEFEEALGIEPNDEELQRLFLFSQTYERRGKDLLFRIFVKYLSMR